MKQMGLLLLAGMVVGCDARGASESTRSSTPPLVHENPQPALDEAAAWRVDTNAAVTIGAGDPRAAAGDTLYEFNDIIGAQFLGDGRIVVAVMGSYALRFYDAAGTFVGSAGRRGEGPGEFRQILKLFRMRGDTLAVNDYHVEVDWFDASGGTITSGRARRRGLVQLQTVAMLENGTYFGIVATGFQRGDRLQQRQLGLVRVRAERGEVDTVAVLPGIFETIRAPGASPEMAVFTPHMLIAVLEDSLVTASSASYELQIRGADGQVGRVIRRELEGTPVSTELKERYRSYALNRRDEKGQPFSERWRQQRERFFARDPFVDTLPRIQDILVSRDGDIWVAHYSAASEFRRNWSVGTQWQDHPTAWDVFERSGRWLTTVTLPSRFTLLDVSGQLVLGLVANEDEEQGVRVLRLEKP